MTERDQTLPIQDFGVHEIPTPDILRFTDEARSALENAGGLIYVLTGMPMRLKVPAYLTKEEFNQKHPGIDIVSGYISKTGKVFYYSPVVHTIESIRSEVAFIPDIAKFSYEGTSQSRTRDITRGASLTLKEMNELADSYGMDAQDTLGISGIRGIQGSVADYVELYRKHLDATGEFLFAQGYTYEYYGRKTNKIKAGWWVRANPAIKVDFPEQNKTTLSPQLRWERGPIPKSGPKLSLRWRRVSLRDYGAEPFPLIVPRQSNLK